MHDIFGYPAHFSILTTVSKQQPSRPSVQACLRLRLVRPIRPTRPTNPSVQTGLHGRLSRSIWPTQPTHPT
ncbi:hypothetical protein BpHYR1_038023 [Brachionus plicatilis]|uniref:Uncharacterized protein n=1 Tax=Brachionus plicatilis TaxID=10195 RepID=A0A3M7QPZ1_BRAPC|nr:hypothetical protein BpHYR1_038023 [Brachionus plicatilis]